LPFLVWLSALPARLLQVFEELGLLSTFAAFDATDDEVCLLFAMVTSFLKYS
jgi:hypothetical protein